MNPLRHIYMAFRGCGDLITFKVLAPLKNKCYKDNKGSVAIWYDNLCDILSHGTTERGYWMYKFYKTPRHEQKQYIDYISFMTKRNDLNMHPRVTYTTGERFNYICLLRDKFVFGRFLSQLGFPVAQDILLIDGRRGTIREVGNLNGTEQNIECILNYDFDAFCKIVSGECGRGVFRLACKNGQLTGEVNNIEHLKKLIGSSMFVVQKRLEQHEEISKIYPHSINTIRLITCLSPDGKITTLPAVIRFGANGNVVDNWAAGGLIVAVDENGYMKGNGLYEFPINGIIETGIHPDTKIKFEGLQVPFYKEAVSTACRLHQYLYGIPCIGWDIAITQQGIVFIEGNDNFEITLNQAAHGGFKNRWLESIGFTPPILQIANYKPFICPVCTKQAA